jgi:hypothetical protein
MVVTRGWSRGDGGHRASAGQEEGVPSLLRSKDECRAQLMTVHCSAHFKIAVRKCSHHKINAQGSRCVNQPDSIFLFISHNVTLYLTTIYKCKPGAWLTLVILATQEAEIRRITVQSQLWQIVHKTLSQKNHHKKGLVEWLKV